MKVTLFAICDRASLDQDMCLTLERVRHHYLVDRLPVELDLMAGVIFEQMPKERVIETEAAIKVVDQDGVEMKASTFRFAYSEWPDPEETHSLHYSRLRGIPFVKDGWHHFNLEVNGEIVATHRLQIRAIERT